MAKADYKEFAEYLRNYYEEVLCSCCQDAQCQYPLCSMCRKSADSGEGKSYTECSSCKLPVCSNCISACADCGELYMHCNTCIKLGLATKEPIVELKKGVFEWYSEKEVYLCTECINDHYA